MSVIVTDAGFGPDKAADWHDLAPDTPPKEMARIVQEAGAIRITFPNFADGRGFTLAASLRRAGFTGRLRAAGYVLADQYAMARRAGFDEVEISDALAARQPEAQWLARANWAVHDYRARLRRRA